jgi:hypothetical protein
MTAALKKSEPLWDRQAFDVFYAELTSERRAADAKMLVPIFNLAAKVPLLQSALAWKEEYGVVTFVDRQCTDVSGYYQEGTGVIALSSRRLERKERRAYIVGVEVHEDIHALDDFKGLLPNARQPFPDYLRNLFLAEAHSYAHQKIAEGQAAMVLPNSLENYVSRDLLQQSPWQHFKNWFFSDKPQIYGEMAMQMWGKKLGIPGARPGNNHYEFDLGLHFSTKPGIDVTNLKDVFLFNAGFDGKPFFDMKEAPEFFAKVLDPDFALRFCNPDREQPEPMVQAILRRQQRGLRGSAGSY